MGPQQRLQEVERRPGSGAQGASPPLRSEEQGFLPDPIKNHQPPFSIRAGSQEDAGTTAVGEERARGRARSDLRDLVHERPRQPLHTNHARRRPSARTDQDAGQHPRMPPAARSTSPLQPEAASLVPEIPHVGRRAVDPRRHLHRQAGRASPGPFSGAGRGRRAGERWRRQGNPNRPRVALGRTTRGLSVLIVPSLYA
jgi:hypothetical protein